MPAFTHLHTHSHYSLLSALPKVDQLVDEARKLGMKALALTDNGNLYGAIEFYKTCKKKDIKPIIGVDFYVAARSRKDMQAGIDNRRSRLVLLATNETGYKNLIRLVTDSHLEGFYYKPRIDRELIEKYNEGLIAISPSFSGEIAQSLKGRNQDKAREVAEFYKKIFGGRLYIEVTHHPEIDGHEANMKTLVEFAKENESFKVEAGFLSGKLVSKEQVKVLATLPSREVMLARVVGGIQAPISGFVGVLAGTLRKVVTAFDAIAKKKSNG